MSDTPMSAEDREQLLKALWESKRQTSWPIFQTLTSGKRKREYAKQDRLMDQYAEGLPHIPVSRCPICDTVLEYAFDSIGLDGLWWFKDALAEYPAPNACEHFKVLLGAVDFHGRQPTEAKVHRTVLPGPGVPFVIPRLMEIDTMCAVISSFQLSQGDTAYSIAYFCDRPLHDAYLHQPWARESYQVFDEKGEYESWTMANDKWDFNLRPWIDKRWLFWINPGDDLLAVQRQGVFPYENLPGIKAPQIIERGKLSTLPLPSGERVNPFA